MLFKIFRTSSESTFTMSMIHPLIRQNGTLHLPWFWQNVQNHQIQDFSLIIICMIFFFLRSVIISKFALIHVCEKLNLNQASSTSILMNMSSGLYQTKNWLLSVMGCLFVLLLLGLCIGIPLSTKKSSLPNTEPTPSNPGLSKSFNHRTTNSKCRAT